MDNALHSPRLRALARYWQGLRSGRSMPARADIDPIDIPTLLPVAILVDARPETPIVRLVGSETTDLLGRDCRGLPVDQCPFGAFTVAWREAVTRAIRTAAPAGATGIIGGERQEVEIEILLLPLSEDGLSVGWLIGGIQIRPKQAVQSERQTRPMRRSPGSATGPQPLESCCR